MLDALGRAQLASGDSTQAISTFSKLAAMQPRSPEPRMRLAEAYMAANNQAAARDSLNRALEVAPKFLPAQRGSDHAGTVRPDDRTRRWRSLAGCRASRPDQSAGYVFAGDIEASRKNWDAAAAAYRAALRPRDVHRSGRQAVRRSRLGQEECRSRRFRSPVDQGASAGRGISAAYLGDLAHLETRLSSRRSRIPRGAQAAARQRGRAQQPGVGHQQVEEAGAIAYAEKANALQPEQPAFMDTLATVLADAGQVSKALEIEKKAIALQPDNPARSD